MPTVPPIDRRSLKKEGLFDEKRFYTLLSEKNNYMDPKTMERFYMGFVKMVSKELKEKGFVHLPHLGEFAVVRMKDKMAWAGKIRQMVHGKYMLKFYPKEVWKNYITSTKNKEGYSARLDPREKILNREIE